MALPSLSRHLTYGTRRVMSTAVSNVTTRTTLKDFSFIPNLFSESEQKILISSSLQKLDSAERREFRRRRKEYFKQRSTDDASSSHLNDLFLPDNFYSFEEGHYDGVIRNYREMHVSSWPEEYPEMPSLLDRLKSVHPDEPTQTHILHLASDGEILPHIDNLQASGSWILGVSLGSSRILRIENVDDPTDVHELMLPSGSVYLQRDSTRYSYKHSILKGGTDPETSGQRLSIMIRNLFRG
ncbi:hypothetical protein QCA50_003248 [Cerrena zonata]|uniref:Fe2OG dioxygenase domain-containing protein n=1 Tax=Cerrena zonata TaxID=2478898 RepID=A0AAW0GTK2_9APHY